MKQDFREFMKTRIEPGGGVAKTIQNGSEAFNGQIPGPENILSDGGSIPGSGPQPSPISKVLSDQVKPPPKADTKKLGKILLITSALLITAAVIYVLLDDQPSNNNSNNPKTKNNV